MEHWNSLASVALLCLGGLFIFVNYYWLLKKRILSNRPLLEVLYEPNHETAGEAEVDIIAVHGLGADVDKAWTWKEGSQLVNWLKDQEMLPKIVNKARIMTYKYESAWHANAPKTRLQSRGEALMFDIDRNRESNRERPIIFIGHSLGGLVIEYGLLFAKEQPHLQHLVEHTVGCVFLGTPFRGSKVQGLAYFAARVMFLAGSHTSIIRDLAYDNKTLRDALKRFCLLVQVAQIPIFCFFENRSTDYGKKIGIPHIIKRMVVEEQSACIEGHGRLELEADHIMLNKFSRPDDPSFERVSGEINKMYRGVIDSQDKKNSRCLADLRVTDPRDDKKHIEKTNGGLLRDSYRLILDSSDFRRWYNDSQRRLQWIKGDPGNGKTMLLCGVIDELVETSLVSYFFCQGTDSRINNATAVLRGLIYLLVDQQPSLIRHVREKYDFAGKALFEDANAWVALSEIFTKILQDRTLSDTYLIIDALDECLTDLPQLLDFIVQSAASTRPKWIISSRNRPDIEERLGPAGQIIKLCLELNVEPISTAITIPADHADRIESTAREESIKQKLQAIREKKKMSQELLQAVGRDDVQKVRSLLESGADPNVPGEIHIHDQFDGESVREGVKGEEILPLYVAALRRSNEIIQLLVKHGSIIDDTSVDMYETALHAAIHAKNSEGVEALLVARADANRECRGLGSPLQHAARFANGNTAIVKMLLAAHANIDARGSLGTALDSAVDVNDWKCVRFLVKAGADLDILGSDIRQAIKSRLPTY